jgi:hypothetical protein
MPWKHGDLTAQAHASAANGSGSLMGYTTWLGGEGPMARILFWGGSYHVHELSLAGGGRWKHSDLTTKTPAPEAYMQLTGYTTYLRGQGPVARVLYRVGEYEGNIHELSRSGGGRWKHTDLTTQTDAPTAGGSSSMMGYTTYLDGQGPVARVLYYSDKDSHVHELSLAGGGRWEHTDLTTQADAPICASSPMGYTTCLGGQGPVARVLYLGQEHHQHVHELSLADGGRWEHTDLTTQAQAPIAPASVPMAYTTCLDSEGPVARVLYVGREDPEHVHELSLAGGGRWEHTNLTDQAQAPPGAYSVMGYTTCLDGQGPAARVLYFVRQDEHIHELFTFG